MTRPILRRGIGLIDVRTDNTVQISPPDDETQRDAAFVDSLGVVRGPDYGVCDARVDSQCAKEGSGILDARGGTGYQHGEADHAEDGDADVAEAALTGAVGYVAY